MKEMTIKALETAALNNDMLSVAYTAKNGETTVREILVDSVNVEKGYVRIVCEKGFRHMTIANIEVI